MLLAYIRGQLGRLTKNEEGQALVEYALIISLVAVASVVVLGLLGGAVRDTFDGITSHL